MRIQITFVIVLVSALSFAQEGQFSQYFAASSLINPAFTGTIPNISFYTNYKTGGNINSDVYLELMQATFTYPFQKITSVDHQIGAAGITFFSERRGNQGIYTSQKVLLNGTYSLKLSRIYNRELVLGLQGGMVQHRIDGERLTWGSQYNQFLGSGLDNTLPGEIINTEPILYPTFNFGVIYYAYDNENPYIRDQTAIIGLSVDNLNRAYISFGDLENANKSFLFKGFTSIKYPLGPRWFSYPSVYLLYSQGVYQMNAGVYFSTFVNSPTSKTALIVQMGSWYRVGDSLIGLIGFGVDNFRIGFSLDYNTQSFDIRQEIAGTDVATYEISLTINFDKKIPLRNVANPIF